MMRAKTKVKKRRRFAKLIRENQNLKKDIQVLKNFIQSASVMDFRGVKVKCIVDVSKVLERYPDTV